MNRLARRSEEIGFDLTLIAELNLNDIKGERAPSLDAWSTAAALAEEWLAIVNGMWTEEELSYSSDYFQVDGAILEPKPIQKPRPTVYAGGESPAGKELISRTCDA